MRWAETHVSLAHAHLNPWSTLAAACSTQRTRVETLQAPLGPGPAALRSQERTRPPPFFPARGRTRCRRDRQQPQKKTRRQPRGRHHHHFGTGHITQCFWTEWGSWGGKGLSHAGQEAASHQLLLPECPPRATPSTSQALWEDGLFFLTNEGQSGSGGEPGQPDF